MKGKMKATLGLLSAMFILGSVPVMASEKPELYLQAEYIKDSDKAIQVECKIKNGDSVNNGKIRVLYDADKAELQSSGRGDGLGNGMCEINDCLKGNKEEGELVAAFASSENIKKEGSILSMKFQIKDSVKKGDKISFTLKPEKLAGESGDFEGKEVTMEFETGKEEVQTSKLESTTSDKDDNKDKSASDKKTGNVKTGDEAAAGKYMALGIGAGIIALVGIASATKKKRC